MSRLRAQERTFLPLLHLWGCRSPRRGHSFHQSPRADAFPSFITSLPPSLDVSPGSSNRGEGGWRWVWGSRYQDPRSTGWGVGMEYEVMRAQSPASKAAICHFPPSAPPSRPAPAGIVTRQPYRWRGMPAKFTQSWRVNLGERRWRVEQEPREGTRSWKRVCK